MRDKIIRVKIIKYLMFAFTYKKCDKLHLEIFDTLCVDTVPIVIPNNINWNNKSIVFNINPNWHSK